MRRHIAPTITAATLGVAMGLIAPAIYHLGDTAVTASPDTVSEVVTGVKVPVPGPTVKVAVPGPTVTVTAKPTHVSDLPKVIQEDDPRWNCLTMGNHRCGRDWVPVTSVMADDLSEGSDNPITYPWESCLTRYDKADDATVVVCPDGTVVVS